MTDLERILDVRQSESDLSVFHVTVQGGKTVHSFIRELDKNHGLAFPAMGNYAGQTVAGIVSTSTHGSMIGTKTMSNFVYGFHIIIAGGIQLKVRKPEEGETDEEFSVVEDRVNGASYGDPVIELVSSDVFNAVAVGIGSLGVIYSVTFECTTMFNIEETRQIFTIDCPRPGEYVEEFRIPKEIKEMYTHNGKYFSFFVNPFPRKRCCNKRNYVKGVFLAGEEVEYHGCCQCDHCIDLQCGVCCTGCRGKSACQAVQTDCSAAFLQHCAQCCCTSCIPIITDFGLNNFARKLPYIHKWYNVLTFTNGNIHVKTAEYCIPLENLENALANVIKMAQFYAGEHAMYSLLPIYVRFVKADDLYLSPANRNRPDGTTCDEYCYIEVPFLPGAYAVDEYHRSLENFLFEKYRARPHWAKNNFLTAHRVKELYPDLDKWKKVFLLFNKDRSFDNVFTNYAGFDEFHHTESAWLGHGIDTYMTVTSQPKKQLENEET
ncbi:L-gulono-1,4-lactone dehydrogenase-like [Saccoglossus kowalevskii]|uniref:Uncharacterized protein LOC100366811 n=1 Tax=Saccoglossus kowalevskii TaxID=10224 RepID=A0ABM0GR98_SACKO|nr:PREDICTED: uncharacterized protein LOC100366811 [Saccoglossus kowalevskii]